MDKLRKTVGGFELVAKVAKYDVDLNPIRMATKVDKELGKGLSTNDYTTSDMEKLGAIESGAEVNVIETVKIDGTALTVTDKAVDITLSGKADKADLTVTPGTGLNSDKTTIQLKSGVTATVLTAHQDISGKADKSEMSVESVAGDTSKKKITLKSGLEQEVLVEHKEQVQADWNQTDNSKPDYIKNIPDNLVKDSSYVHTDNNFTDEDKEKLDNIESGAEVNNTIECASGSDIGSIGTPTVTASTDTTLHKTTLTFNYLKGEKGDPGTNGTNGTNGTDGVSCTHSWDGTTLSVTSASGTSSANLKGDKGDPGTNGTNGTNGTDGVSCTHSWNGTTLSITSASGTSSANLKGDKGDPGTNGTNGTNGTDGTSAKWWTGTAMSGTGTKSVTITGAHTNDMYLNTTTADVYEASSASSWIYKCNIKGASGSWEGQVDTAISSTSTNPVQNKVVYNELAKKTPFIIDTVKHNDDTAVGAFETISYPDGNPVIFCKLILPKNNRPCVLDFTCMIEELYSYGANDTRLGECSIPWCVYNGSTRIMKQALHGSYQMAVGTDGGYWSSASFRCVCEVNTSDTIYIEAYRPNNTVLKTMVNQFNVRGIGFYTD